MKKQKLLLFLLGVLIALPAVAQEFSYEYEGQTLNYIVYHSMSNPDANLCRPKDGRSKNSPGNKVSEKVILPAHPIWNKTEYTLEFIPNYAFKSDYDFLFEVVIPSTVTRIGHDVLCGCDYIETLDFSSVESICGIQYDSEEDNFIRIAENVTINGEEVTDLVIPESVTHIYNYAFSGWESLTSVTIPASVQSIGRGAFAGCRFEKVEFASIEQLCNIEFGDQAANPLANAQHVYINGEEVTDLVIPESVTSIGNYAFYNCSSLTSIEIPGSVNTIGAGAFSDCSSLTSIEIPGSVNTIGAGAFSDCSSLTSLTIADGETTLAFGKDALKNAPIETLYMGRDWTYTEYDAISTGIKSVTIGNQVKSIPERAFIFCGNLNSVVIGNSVETIGSNAFCYCGGLTSVVIPNSVKTIGDEAFRYCGSLTSAVIGNSVTSIGTDAFSGCSGLIKSAYPNTIKNPFVNPWGSYGVCIAYPAEGAIIEDGCVYGPDKSAIYFAPLSLEGEFTIPNSVETIGDNAFNRCSSLTSVVIPNSVQTIGDSAFYGCSGMTSVEIPNSVTSIGRDAFNGCSGLTSIEIPNSVQTIGKSAFNGCSGLTSVVIPNSVTSIGWSAFEQCSGLTSVIIPNSVKIINGSAFSGCSGLTSVIIPNSVETIGFYAFEDCSNLTSLTVADGETTLAFEKDALKDAPIETLYMGRDWSYTESAAISTSLKSVTIGNQVKSIPNNALRNCTGITSVEIPNSVTSLGDSAFYNCSGLTSVVIPNSVTSIGNYAFYGCSGMTSVVIPNSVETIGSYAFHKCSGMTSVVIPNSVTSLGDYTFSGCSSLTSVVIPNSVESIGYMAFYGCSGLTSVVIPNSVTSIGSYAFSGCSGMTSVEIPNSVTSIGESAFEGCSGLTSVVIGNSVQTIGSYAFYDCSSLKKSAYPNTITKPFSSGTCISYPADGAIIEDGFVYSSDKSAIYFAPLTLEGEFTITNSVETIGSYAFSYCSGLTSLTVADGETTLAFEKDALKDAPIETLYMGRDWSYTESAAISTGLKSVTIGNQVKNIPNYAFRNCTGMTSVQVGWEKPLAISENVFSNDTYATATLDIPDNTLLDYMAQTTTWGKFSNMSVDGTATKLFSDNVFRYRLIENDAHDAVLIAGDYSSMTEANIPERFTDDSDPANPVRYYVTAIGPNAFKGCSKLESVIFNSRSKLTAIGAASFSGCTGLTSMAMPAELTAINANAFENCSGMTDIKLNDKLATLGRSAFAGCTGLTSFTMSKDMTEIGPQAFNGCNNITAFNLNDKLTTICDSAFFNCKALPEISIPASVREIRRSAFGECAGLEKAEFASIEDLCKIDFIGNNWSNPLNFANHLYINGEEVTEVVVPDGIEKLKTTFVGCSYITSVSLPNSLQVIAGLSFYDCSSLTSIEIPNSVKSISGNGAFLSCSSLSSVKFGENIEKIGKSAFEKCSSLNEISIPASVTFIGEGAFSGCSDLTSLILLDGDELLEFGSSVFSGASIKELYYGRPTNTDQFQNRWSLTTVNVANTMTEIYPATFKGCDELVTLNLGSSLTTIGDEAFSGCKALTKVIVPPSVETIGEKAFANIPDLATIVMGHSVANIGAEAFDGASARDIYITAQVPPTAPNTTFSSYTGKLWLQDQGDNKVLDAYYDAFTCWDRFDSQAMVVATSIECDKQVISGEVGQTIKITGTVMPENASLPYVFWHSTDPNVATIYKFDNTTSSPGEVWVTIVGDSEATECKIIGETLYADGPVCEVTVNVDTTGIDDVIADSADNSGDIDYSAPYEVYNLNGVKVAVDSLEGLNHGFYIIRQGSVAKKIALN